MRWPNPFVSLAEVALGSRIAPHLDQAIITSIGTMLRPARAWAAAELAEGDLDKLRNILGLESDAGRYGNRALLKHMHAVSARAELARLEWQSTLFGGTSSMESCNNFSTSYLAAATAEAMRQRVERSLHRMKPFFLPFAAAPMSAVGGRPATPAEALKLLGHLTRRPPISRDTINRFPPQRSRVILTRPTGGKKNDTDKKHNLYGFLNSNNTSLEQIDILPSSLKPTSPIIDSKHPTQFPTITSWLRWPAEDGYGYARVIEPLLSGYQSEISDPNQLISDIPAIVICHGLGVEYETAGPSINFVRTLARRGLRVVLAEFAGHGKRRKLGLYGGESFMRGQPVTGVLHLLDASDEAARLVAWCRSQGSHIVALAGSSLGAMTAQLAASRAAETPSGREFLPDQLLLVTPTGNLSSLAFSSSIAQASGLDIAIAAAGWNAENFSPYAALVEPSPTPPIDPAAISMVLGTDDTVTPYADGLALARAWKIPECNLLVAGRGHFTSSIAMMLPGSPLDRLVGALLAEQINS